MPACTMATAVHVFTTNVLENCALLDLEQGCHGGVDRHHVHQQPDRAVALSGVGDELFGTAVVGHIEGDPADLAAEARNSSSALLISSAERALITTMRRPPRACGRQPCRCPSTSR